MGSVYICGPSLVLSFEKLQPVSRKMYQIYLDMIYRRPILMCRFDVMSDVINIKNIFSGEIYDVLFISDVTINLSQILQNFQNGRHIHVRASFSTESCAGSEFDSEKVQPIPHILSF